MASNLELEKARKQALAAASECLRAFIAFHEHLAESPRYDMAAISLRDVEDAKTRFKIFTDLFERASKEAAPSASQVVAQISQLLIRVHQSVERLQQVFKENSTESSTLVDFETEAENDKTLLALMELCPDDQEENETAELFGIVTDSIDELFRLCAVVSGECLNFRGKLQNKPSSPTLSSRLSNIFHCVARAKQGVHDLMDVSTLIGSRLSTEDSSEPTTPRIFEDEAKRLERWHRVIDGLQQVDVSRDAEERLIQIGEDIGQMRELILHEDSDIQPYKLQSHQLPSISLVSSRPEETEIAKLYHAISESILKLVSTVELEVIFAGSSFIDERVNTGIYTTKRQYDAPDIWPIPTSDPVELSSDLNWMRMARAQPKTVSRVSDSGYTGLSYDQQSSVMDQAPPERAHQSCEYCRLRKRQCDGFGIQTCSTCKKHDVECRYALKRPNRKVATIETMGKRLVACEAKTEPHEPSLDQLAHAATTAFVPRVLEIKADHYTGSHNLIDSWPTVRRLLEKASIHLSATYVREAEEASVSMNLSASFSTQNYEDVDRDQTLPARAASEAISVQGFSSRRGPPDTHTESSREIKRVRESDTSESVDRDHYIRLFESYVRNIHVMQPFLDLKRIEDLLQRFANEPDVGAQRQVLDDTLERPPSGHDRPTKRRRIGQERSPHRDDYLSQSTRRLENAICCLVLALGWMCDSKERVAQPEECRIQPYPEARHRSESLVTPMPEHGPPEDYFAAQTTTSKPKSPEPTKRGSSIDETLNDDCPGIEYYNMGKRLIGIPMEDEDEDLLQAQFYLLAALYQGQAGKVRQSMNWINKAGRTSLVLLRRKGLLFNFDSKTTTDMKLSSYLQGQLRPADELIVLAAWTCLQLEGDILADLHQPSSGLVEYEEYIPRVFNIPNADDYYERAIGPDSQSTRYTSHGVSVSYMSQLWLRQQLNLMQHQLYGTARSSRSHQELRDYLEEHQSMLDLWRKGLPPIFQWKDADPHGSDILTARLRARYWDARVLATRPFLDYVLHVLPRVKEMSDIRSNALSFNEQSRSEAENQLFEAIHGMPEYSIVQAARNCIEATVQSTRAFDGITHQLIVTNIFGTAHTQFGNMLVLLAAWPSLKAGRIATNIPVGSLLRRTIAFLRSHASLSRTCKIDCSILNDILRWMKHTQRASTNLYIGNFNNTDTTR